MVMRNRDEGSQAPHWWDDLPPKVRTRFSQPIAHDEESSADNTDEPLPALSPGELILDLSRLAGMFVLVALGNILFLLLALTFLHA
jgi:hypothetical protein